MEIKAKKIASPMTLHLDLSTQEPHKHSFKKTIYLNQVCTLPFDENIIINLTVDIRCVILFENYFYITIQTYATL